MLLIGLMSGTSADGIDAALVDVRGKGREVSAKLAGFITEPYPAKIRNRLMAVSEPGGGSAAETAELNVLLGRLFARAALKVCDKAGAGIDKVALIGSHGQTVAHIPEKGATLQIGEPAVIAAITGRPVIADFRPSDMAAGGQGAPLTPLADFILLRHLKLSRVIVNIGGITNITSLPAGMKKPDNLIAFDTGPGNMTLDLLAARITEGVGKYDRGGSLARSGKVRDQWLMEILKHPYFGKKPPKSAGREQFGVQYLNGLISGFRIRSQKGLIDLLATLTVSTAASIARAVSTFVMSSHDVDELLVCGGGAKNSFLMDSLKREIAMMGWTQFGKSMPKPIRVGTTADAGVNPDAREAMAFALLARETWEGRPGNVPSATGAERPAILGKIVRP